MSNQGLELHCLVVLSVLITELVNEKNGMWYLWSGVDDQ